MYRRKMHRIRHAQAIQLGLAEKDDHYCTKCKKWKHKDNFYTITSVRGTSFLGSWCKDCTAEKANGVAKGVKRRREEEKKQLVDAHVIEDNWVYCTKCKRWQEPENFYKTTTTPWCKDCRRVYAKERKQKVKGVT